MKQRPSTLEDGVCLLLIPAYLALNNAESVSFYLASLTFYLYWLSFSAGHISLILGSLSSCVFTLFYNTQAGFGCFQVFQLAVASLLSARAVLCASGGGGRGSSCWSCGERALLLQAGTVLFFSVLSELSTLVVFGAPLVIGQRAAVSTIVRFSLAVLCLFVFLLYGARRFLNIVHSSTFVSLWLTCLAIAVFLTNSAAINQNFLRWVLLYITDSSTKVYLLCVWAVLFSVAVCSAVLCSFMGIHTGGQRAVLRKLFHLLLSIVIVQGVFQDVLLLYASSAALFFCLILAESVRLSRCGTISAIIQSCYEPFVDGKDKNPFVLCNIYLLTGCTGELWYSGTLNIVSGPSSVTLLSGVITVAIGDAAGACVGVLWGRIPLGIRGRTMEGSSAMFICQLFACYFLSLTGYVTISGGVCGWLAVLVSCCVSTVWEALTVTQDNLTLPLVFNVVFLSFSKASKHCFDFCDF